MPEIRGITISVNYGPLLAVTLVRNMRHLTECLVVTSHDDRETQDVARSIPGVSVLATDAFCRHGAAFNKGLAMEEGFEALGRDGWILIWDADCLLPDRPAYDGIQPGWLYGSRRRILEDPTRFRDGLDWSELPISHDGGPIGFHQLFHADAIADKRPWYDVSFSHAGGGDAYFMTHWDRSRLSVLNMDVLHLGPKDTNWFGTSPEARDVMAAYVVRNGWDRSHPLVDRTADARVGEIVERVTVPGYEPSGYELPFVLRSRRLIRGGLP